MEQPVQQRGLKRELRLADLVLMQVLLIVGLGWVGTVGVEGSTLPFQIVPIMGVNGPLWFCRRWEA